MVDLHLCVLQKASSSSFFLKFPFRIAKIHTVRLRKPSSSELAAAIFYVAVSYF